MAASDYRDNSHSQPASQPVHPTYGHWPDHTEEARSLLLRWPDRMVRQTIFNGSSQSVTVARKREEISGAEKPSSRAGCVFRDWFYRVLLPVLYIW